MRANTFVEREPELEQLQHFLSKASVGQGQVCFVTGEAAGGQAALGQEVLRRAPENDVNAVAAGGPRQVCPGA